MDAVYRDGVLVLAKPLDLAENSRVLVHVPAREVHAVMPSLPSLGRGFSLPRFLIDWIARGWTLEWALLGAGLLVYAVTRFWALDLFPGWFMVDEAWMANTAQDLINRGLRDDQGGWLPAYFNPGPRWQPTLAVYAHVLSVFLFGKSIVVARATLGAATLLGTAALCFILKVIFKARYWWAGVLVMAVMPVWFQFSRTAFETVMTASFFALFLLFYLLYRTRSPRYMFAALPVGAVAFYAYSSGHLIIGVFAVFLLVSDSRYHVRQWRVLLAALPLAVLLALPLIGFQLNHSAALGDALRAIDSPLAKQTTVQEKLLRFAQIYWQGITPQYWFFPNHLDFDRFRMEGYAHIPTVMLPLFLVGILLSLRRMRSSAHRTVLAALLACPFGAVPIEVSSARVLPFVVPAAILIVLGSEPLLARLPRRIPFWMPAMVIVVLMSAGMVAMLRDSLDNGLLWYRDYGRYGAHWGAREVFQGPVLQYLTSNPNAHVVVSPDWAAGVDVFNRFFVPPDKQKRVEIGTVDAFKSSKRDLDANTIFVMTAQEYGSASASSLFKLVQVERQIPHPDGTPGFYIARLTYADNVEAQLSAQREARRQPVQEGQVQISDQMVRVRCSQLDMGDIRNAFDGDPKSLVRGAEANPFVLELLFPRPRPVTGLAVDVNNLDFSLNVDLYPEGSDNPVSYAGTWRPALSHGDLSFEKAPGPVSKMRVEIKNLSAGETDHIHLYEMALR